MWDEHVRCVQLCVCLKRPAIGREMRARNAIKYILSQSNRTVMRNGEICSIKKGTLEVNTQRAIARKIIRYPSNSIQMHKYVSTRISDELFEFTRFDPNSRGFCIALLSGFMATAAKMARAWSMRNFSQSNCWSRFA